jgi:hypothetical protein
MKKLSLILAALTLSTLVGATEPKVIISPVEHLFVPKGFDNNDNIEVVVTGKFPNPCYIRNKVEVEVMGEKVFIRVTALKKDDGKAELCEKMSVPFKEAVTLGNFQGGNYEVIVNENTRFEQKDNLEVAVSTSRSVDEHLYPIVDYIDLGFTGGMSGSVMLVARTPSDCVAFDKVEIISNGKDSLSILPIMKKVSSQCNENKRQITIPVKFDASKIRNKDILLFVRSIEGKSVNSIISR